MAYLANYVVFGQLWCIWPNLKPCEIRIPLICWSKKGSQKVQEESAKMLHKKVLPIIKVLKIVHKKVHSHPKSL